ncbi:MAG: hypothetical protein WBC21_00035 [Minisyncoccales bacterium]
MSNQNFSKFLNRGISTPIGILIIVLVAFIVGGGILTWQYFGTPEEKVKTSEEIDKTDKDVVLVKIKENLEKIKSVHAVKKVKEYSKVQKGEMRERSQVELYLLQGGDAEYYFIFPNKKRIVSSFSIQEYLKEENTELIELTDEKDEVIIIDNNIYLKFAFLDLFYKEETGMESPYQWFHGKDGQSMPSLISDSPGETIDFNLKIYPEGWNFTKKIEAIEEDLGTEEINGIRCHHYKIKIEKKSLVAVFEAEQKGDKIRFVKGDKEILIPIPEPELMTVPATIIGISESEYPGPSYRYRVSTWSTGGEIWVGEDDFFVHKEKIITEHAYFFFDPAKSEEENKEKGMLFTKNISEITYSDFDKDMRIESPKEKVVTVTEYLKQMGYPVTEEEISEAEKKERDEIRKYRLEHLASHLEGYYRDHNQYPVAESLEKVSSEESNFYKSLVPDYIWGGNKDFLFDSKHPEFWYSYKSGGSCYELTARLENIKDKDCVMENDICLYKYKGGTCANMWIDILKENEKPGTEQHTYNIEVLSDESCSLTVYVKNTGEVPLRNVRVSTNVGITKSIGDINKKEIKQVPIEFMPTNPGLSGLEVTVKSDEGIEKSLTRTLFVYEFDFEVSAPKTVHSGEEVQIDISVTSKVPKTRFIDVSIKTNIIDPWKPGGYKQTFEIPLASLPPFVTKHTSFTWDTSDIVYGRLKINTFLLIGGIEIMKKEKYIDIYD